MTLILENFANQMPIFKDEDLFDQFWAAYPRKADKKKGRKAFDKLKPTQSLVDLMINNIQQRLESGSWRLSEKQYIPIPTTYLNGERWEDEIIQVGEKSKQQTRIETQRKVNDVYNTNW